MDASYYTIKDVAERTGMSPYTLRYYDNEGLLTFVKRSASGIRMFTEEDFEPLYVISCLKRSGMPLKKIRAFMNLYMQGNKTISERRKMFEEQRDAIRNDIAELNKMLEVVDYKCWYFKEAEKQGDAYFYKKIPKEEMPERINEFFDKVNEFRSKDKVNK